MAYYEEFSTYQMHPRYQLSDNQVNNVLNIGWLGEKGSFTQGDSSKEFILNLWDYYRCLLMGTRNIYINESLDGYWKFFKAAYKRRATCVLGHHEIRVIDNKRDVVYAAPDLIIHYIVNHHYLPPEDFIEAVIQGPKPGSQEFCDMVRQMYANFPRPIHSGLKCPYCKSSFLEYVYYEEKFYNYSDDLIVVGADVMPDKEIDNSVRNYYQLCKDCGHLSKFEF